MSQQAKDIYSGIKKRIFPSRRSGSFSFSNPLGSNDSYEASKLRATVAEFNPNSNPQGPSFNNSRRHMKRSSSFTFASLKARLSASDADEAQLQADLAFANGLYRSGESRLSSSSTPSIAEEGTTGSLSVIPMPITPSAKEKKSVKEKLKRATDVLSGGSTSSAPHSHGGTSNNRRSRLTVVSSRPASFTSSRSSSSFSLHSFEKPQDSSRTSTNPKHVMSSTYNQPFKSRSRHDSCSTDSTSSLSTPSPESQDRLSPSTITTVYEEPENQYESAIKSPPSKQTSRPTEQLVKKSSSSRVVDDTVTLSQRREPQPKPQAPPTWMSDSDSETDEENRRHGPRGLDGRSASVDFLEPQSSGTSHLMSKIWKKLPMHARLLGANKNQDLDLEHERSSFTKQKDKKLNDAIEAARAKAMQKSGQRLSEIDAKNKSPGGNVRTPSPRKRTVQFSSSVTYAPNEGLLVPIEGYDDIIVRVCKFASHDTRPVNTKVKDFLERSLLYVNGMKSKFGNDISITNEEIRMWRRLVQHDWASEENTFSTSEEPVIEEDPVENDEEDEEEEVGEPVLEPEVLKDVVKVVNWCINFGSITFHQDHIKQLVQLEYLVEEDGWI